MQNNTRKRLFVPSRSLVPAIALALLCAGLGPASSQNALPPGVHADLLRQKIITAVKHNDLETVVMATDQYKKLGVPMPPAFLLVEAKAEHRLGDSVKAFSTLQAFLGAVDRKSREYREAIHLYPSYQSAAHKITEENAAASAAHSLADAKTEY